MTIVTNKEHLNAALCDTRIHLREAMRYLTAATADTEVGRKRQVFYSLAASIHAMGKAVQTASSAQINAQALVESNDDGSDGKHKT